MGNQDPFSSLFCAPDFSSEYFFFTASIAVGYYPTHS